jgi:hypothetical protein
MPQHERRRHDRRSGLLVRVSVKDQSGHVCQGTVLNVSDGGVGLFTESLPSSELLEIQPANSTLWISVRTKHCTSAASGYVIGCAFLIPAVPEILQALYAPR